MLNYRYVLHLNPPMLTVIFIIGPEDSVNEEFFFS